MISLPGDSSGFCCASPQERELHKKIVGIAAANGYTAELIETGAAAICPWARHLLTTEITCERCHGPTRVRSISFT